MEKILKKLIIWALKDKLRYYRVKGRISSLEMATQRNSEDLVEHMKKKMALEIGTMLWQNGNVLIEEERLMDGEIKITASLYTVK